MRQLFLFDSLSQSLQPIHPLDEKIVRIYTCGPTVYNFAHIGNFRTFLFEDVLRRTLLLFGYKIFHVMNITDVDDKTINGAKEKGCSLKEYTDLYKTAFFEDLSSLRVQKVEAYPEATAYIPQMIEMIQTLIEKKAAYLGQDGSVYFSIASFPTYGSLSHLNLQSLQQGTSLKSTGDDYDKESLSDFVLWKSYEKERDGNVFWNSPWGNGRPGWHIECSVMAKEILGNTIDIHAGGVDLIFPHHENEIAQSEAANGCQFAALWAHAEHLMVDGKKMSKRLHNFYTLRDLLEKGYMKTAIRLLLLSTHYRTQMNFTLEGLDAAFASLRRIRETHQRLQEYTTSFNKDRSLDWIKEYEERFTSALSQDLAISDALASLFDFIREINSRLDRKQLTKEEKEASLQLFSTFDAILDVLTPEETEVPTEIEKLVKEREEARYSKNWKESDRLREELQKKGYVIEDTPKGPKLIHTRNM
jgi:cysteinyl-tRNA synthetase